MFFDQNIQLTKVSKKIGVCKQVQRESKNLLTEKWMVIGSIHFLALYSSLWMRLLHHRFCEEALFYILLEVIQM
jgi:hypothetical protein